MQRARWRVSAAAAVALVAAGLLITGQGAAVADDDPVGTLTGTVRHHLKPVTGAATPKARASHPSHAPGPESSHDETPPNEVADPAPPDHAGAQVLHVEGGGQPIAGTGTSRSTVEDDDSTRGDASWLTLGGMEVGPAAHADSRGQKHDSTRPSAPVSDPACEESDICFDVLYSDANATKSGSRSRSDSSAGLFRFCIGGNGDELDCEAPAKGQVDGSATEADRDRASGRTTASSEADLADLCLTAPGGIPIPGLAIDGGCTFGLSALSSQGHADSGGAHSSASRSSALAGVTLLGQEQEVDNTAGGSLPPDCVPGATVTCAYLNQGETYLGDGYAGHAQEALRVQVLPGVEQLVKDADLLSVVGGRTETLAHNDGGEPRSPQGPGGHVKGAGVNRAPVSVAGAADTGVLPNTGGVWSGLLSAGLLALGAGAMLVVAGRRGRIVPA